METIKNVTQLLVAKDQAVTVSAADVINSIADLADGDVLVTDLKNVVLDAASLPATVPAFKLIQRSGSNLIHSDIITQGLVRSYTLGLQVAEAQQVDYVGYNGVSGALDTIASNIYTIRLYCRDLDTAGFMQQKIKEGFYKSNAVAASYTQQAVALGLVESLIANYSREADQDIAFERINAGALANALATSTVSVVKGSKFIVCSEDMTSLITAGTILRFGATGAGTAPCYVVTGHDGGTTTARIYELDVPWQGVTAAAFAAASFESVTEGAWGISLTGVDRYFLTGKFSSKVNTWVTTIDMGDAAVAVVTASVTPYPGVGTLQQLATLEKELQADEFIYRSFPEGTPIDRADIVGALYDVTIVEFDGSIQSGLGVDVKSPKTLQIALESNTAQGDDTNVGIVTTLNAIIVTKWATPGAAAQTPTA